MPRLPMPTTRTLYLFMRSLAGVLAVPLFHLGNDVINLVGSQFGEHRKTHAPGGIGFGISQAAGYARTFAPRVTRLLVNRNRVMSLGINVVLHEELDHRIAPFGLSRLNDIQMENVPVTRQLHRQVDVLTILQSRGVARGPLPPLVIVFVDVLELRAENSGMQIVQAAVESETVNIACIGAMVA